jgi:hypothetical protein
MKKGIVVILVSLLVLCSNGYIKEEEPTDKIEIYLLNKLVEPVKGDIPVKEFIVSPEDINSDPLIPDRGITSYKLGTYEIKLDSTACKKISQLEPSLPMGIQFVLTLNKKPIITGYFWNKDSSFGTNWYTIVVGEGPWYKIHKGVPEEKNQDLLELRDNVQIVNVLKQSKRLIQ